MLPPRVRRSLGVAVVATIGLGAGRLDAVPPARTGTVAIATHPFATPTAQRAGGAGDRPPARPLPPMPARARGRLRRGRVRRGRTAASVLALAVCAAAALAGIAAIAGVIPEKTCGVAGAAGPPAPAAAVLTVSVGAVCALAAALASRLGAGRRQAAAGAGMAFAALMLAVAVGMATRNTCGLLVP